MKLVLKTTNGSPASTAVKRNASIKYMFKALLMNNYDIIEDAFVNAKDKDKLSFICKISALFCARQNSEENGGEWILPEEMDATWFNKEEVGSVSRRRQRNEAYYCRAMNDLNYTHHVEWQNIRDVMEECRKANVEMEDMRKMLAERIESYYKMVREDKARLEDIFLELHDYYDQIMENTKTQFNDKPNFPSSNVKTEIANLSIPSFPDRKGHDSQQIQSATRCAVSK